MAQMNSKVKAIVDMDSKATLRAQSDGAETTSVNETAIALNVLDAAYWQTDGEQADKQFAINLHVTALDLANADETYSIAIVADDAADFASKQTIATFTVTATGYQQEYVNMDLVADKFSNPVTHMRAELTVGGTTPSIDYHAWLSPIPKHG